MHTNPLTIWLQQRLAERDEAFSVRSLTPQPTRAVLERHQSALLRETLTHAVRSRHYVERFRDIDLVKIAEKPPLAVLSELPFTTQGELRADPHAFLCVPPDEVERIVTLPTSGTTGAPKRVFFSAAELEQTAHFFRFGMQNIARRGGRTMIFMRGGRPDGFAVPDGVCDLLTRSLAAFDCAATTYGEISDPAHAYAALCAAAPTCVVAVASQLRELVRLGDAPSVKTVLLSADNTPDDAIAELKKAWNCSVFRHYGMTETAFGCAVDCAEGSGMLLREPDMIIEVIDPVTGAQLPDGERGELVLTTLTRRVMPLVRYRTGDFSQILATPSAAVDCGTDGDADCILRRLDTVQGHG